MTLIYDGMDEGMTTGVRQESRERKRGWEKEEEREGESSTNRIKRLQATPVNLLSTWWQRDDDVSTGSQSKHTGARARTHTLKTVSVSADM